MKFPALIFVSLSLCMSAEVLRAAPTSDYAGQDTREIKALSAEETGDLIQGKGMGLAKSAELNGYPGPAHVLELADALELTPEQRSQTQALKTAMTAKASSIGQALVAAERKLDLLFASKTITNAQLGNSLDEIGNLQARLRRAHLEAHIAQVLVLTAEQSARYTKLRGYGGVANTASEAHSHHNH